MERPYSTQYITTKGRSHEGDLRTRECCCYGGKDFSSTKQRPLTLNKFVYKPRWIAEKNPSLNCALQQVRLLIPEFPPYRIFRGQISSLYLNNVGAKLQIDAKILENLPCSARCEIRTILSALIIRPPGQVLLVGWGR